MVKIIYKKTLTDEPMKYVNERTKLINVEKICNKSMMKYKDR